MPNTLQSLILRIYQQNPPTSLARHPYALSACLTASPHHSVAKSGAGIFNLLLITYSYWPRLRVSTNPERMNLSHGILGLSANRNFTCFFVTYTNILTSLLPPSVFTVRLTNRERSSTRLQFRRITKSIASVVRLSPVHTSAQKPSTSELLRFL